MSRIMTLCTNPCTAKADAGDMSGLIEEVSVDYLRTMNKIVLEAQTKEVSVFGFGLVRFGLVWFGLVWFGLVWFGLVWFGLVWFGLAWFGLVWFGLFLIGSLWLGLFLLFFA